MCVCVCVCAYVCVQDAGIKTADAVLLGIHEELAPQEADAMVLASLLQVG